MRQELPDRSESRQMRAVLGCLLGCAVGDSIGLPYEGLSAARVKKFAKLPLTQKLAFRRGLLSDDTDHTIFVAQALLQAGAIAGSQSERNKPDIEVFRNKLSWKLRFWLLCLPAGIGFGTLRAILRMWLGFAKPGVFSAGNGPAMRSAIIGAVFAHDAALRRNFVHTSTTLTHTDPQAFAGAMAVAEIAAQLVAGTWQQRPSVEELNALLQKVSDDPHWRKALAGISECCQTPDPVAAAAARFGGKNGVQGYVMHSVPFAVVVWHTYFNDVLGCVQAIVLTGGDTDTNAAIAGALAGASPNAEIPENWLAWIADWPHSLSYLRQLAAALNHAAPVDTRFSPALMLRGFAFTGVVLAHGFRRLLPPY